MFVDSNVVCIYNCVCVCVCVGMHSDLNVDGWPIANEHAMPEQYSKENAATKGFYTHFFDTGDKLKKAGVSVRKSGEHLAGTSGHKSKIVQLDQNFESSGYWPLAGEPNKLETNGFH